MIDFKTLLDSFRNKVKGDDNYIFIKTNQTLERVEKIKDVNITFIGKNNIIIFEQSKHIRNVNIVLGNSSICYFSSSIYRINNLIIAGKHCKNSYIYIGENLSCNDCIIHINEDSSLYIGNDCMFASQIAMFANDGHAIFSNGRLINRPGDIIIEDHVWIGYHVTILKDSHLYKNTIVGAMSLVTKNSNDHNKKEEGVVISGNPGKIIKNNCTWDRKGPMNFINIDSKKHTKYTIVGAGFWGATLAERIATVLKEPVTIIDRRDHIGGNCHSSLDEETGIECHRYGSHIFHTSLPQVWDYINQFGEFTSYQHKVFITHKGKVYTMPINLSTINAYYGKNFRPEEAAAFLEAEIARDFIAEPKNLEEKAISLIGRPLYEAFIRGYTHKQWEHDPRELPASIINRLPFRTNYNANYFSDVWQGVPKDGYFSIFKRMLDNPLITLKLNCEFESIRPQLPADCTVIYTGMPDQLFQYKYGELEWRSLRFEWETLPVRDYQGTTVMNYADVDVPFTRVHEFKHYHPERTAPFALDKTIICREYSKTYRQGDEAYYPVNNARNNEMYAKYAEEAARMPRLILGGRLGVYRYWDMDKAIADALNVFETKIRPTGA